MGLLLIKIAVSVILLELAVRFTVRSLRKRFQWLITIDDEQPRLDPEGLKKFIRHGFDPELGWVRKPNTWHDEKGRAGRTSYHINELGVRSHPGLEDLPMKIACFGDSFTFCRQVNDDQTWPWHLASLAGAGVVNFGVGNYGVDQACLRMKRELSKIHPEVVIMGVVPSTIVRILSVWKHYNEFGNTFGFKPRYDLENGRLKLIKNIIDDEAKLHEYDKYLKSIQANDYFYLTKFRDEMIRFPYLYSTLRKPDRNFPIISALLLSAILRGAGIKNERLDGYPMMKIMNINRILRRWLFQDRSATDLFNAIIEEFIKEVKNKGAKPVFLFMPQKDDLSLIRGKGPYYDSFTNRIREKALVVDMTDYLLGASNLDELYSDDNEYGGHFSSDGNKFVAKTIYEVLAQNGYL